MHTNAIGETAVVGVLLSSSVAGRCRYSILSWATPPHRLEKWNSRRRSTNLGFGCLSPQGFYRYAGSLTTAGVHGRRAMVPSWKIQFPSTARALAKLHSLISMFPQLQRIPKQQPAYKSNLNGRTVLKTIDFNPWP